MHGWGVRPYDWQFGVGVQQEMLPRVSVDVSYNRRWWGNFFVTDNLALGVDGLHAGVTLTAPSEREAARAAAATRSRSTRNTNAPLGATDNYYTSADDYGDGTAYWHGVDVSVNARMRNGLVLQGGFSTGAGHRDNCEVTAKAARAARGRFPFTTQPISSCKVRRAVADDRPARSGDLHDPEDRRPGQRDRAVAGRTCSPTTSGTLRGHQRRVARRPTTT